MFDEPPLESATAQEPQGFRPVRFAYRVAHRSLIPLWGAGILLVGLQLVMPIQVGRLTKLFQAEGADVSIRLVTRAVLLIVASQLLVSLIQYWQAKKLVWLREQLTRLLSMQLFHRVIRFSGKFFQENEVASINTRILEDTQALVTHISQVLVTVPVSCLMVAIFSCYMISQNVFLGICMLPLTLLPGYFLIFDKQIQEINRKQRQIWDEIRVDSTEVLGGVGELRVHDAFDYGLRNLDSDFKNYSTLMNRLGSWAAFFEAARPIVSTIQNSAVYWLGALMCINGTFLGGFAGQMNWGDVIKFMLIVGLFQQPVSQIAMFLLAWRMSRERIRRVRELFDHPLEFSHKKQLEADPEGSPQCSVEFNEVSVLSAANTPILQNVSINIPQLQKVGLVGPAGCGKSTLMQLLVCGQACSTGDIRIGPRNFEDYHISEIARKIGHVNQKPVLFKASIRHNLLLGLRRPSRRVLFDEHGPIDISLLPEVESMHDLHRELIRLVKLVHFDQDLFHKGLVLRGEGNGRKELRCIIGQIRDALSAAAEAGESLPVERFEVSALLESGTLLENILGPNSVLNRDPCVFTVIRDSGLQSHLLYLGRNRILEDRALAAKLSRDNPGLVALLSREPDADIPGETTPEELSRFPVDTQWILLQTALDLEIAAARELGESELLTDALLDARRRLREMEIPRSIWPRQEEWSDNLSVRENLLFGRARKGVYRSEELVDRALSTVLQQYQLLDSVILLGMEFQVGDQGKLLSGGQRQKVSLIRTFLKRPEILLLDEATASLDEISQRRVVESLAREFTQCTQLTISHRLSTILEHDQILVMDRGQIVQRGRYEELIQHPGLFADLVAKQQDASSATVRHNLSLLPAPESISYLHPLRTCLLFSQLRSEQLALLERQGQRVECEAGTVLFERGDVGTDLLIILEGEVEFFVNSSRGMRVVSTAGKGTSFGELGLLGAQTRAVGVRAITHLKLFVLSRENIIQLITADSGVALELLRAVAQRASQLAEELYDSPDTA